MVLKSPYIVPKISVGPFFAASFPYDISLYTTGIKPAYYKISPYDDFVLFKTGGTVLRKVISGPTDIRNEEFIKQSSGLYRTWELVSSKLGLPLPIIYQKSLGDYQVNYRLVLNSSLEEITIHKVISGFSEPVYGFGNTLIFNKDDRISVGANLQNLSDISASASGKMILSSPGYIMIKNPRERGSIGIPVSPFDKVTIDFDYKLLEVTRAFPEPQKGVDITWDLDIYD